MTQDNLWVYILSLLEKQALYPYEVRGKVQAAYGFLPGNVTAYLVLKKLQAGGYVRKAMSEKGKGPDRTYYAATPKGLEELKKAKAFYREMGKFFS